MSIITITSDWSRDDFYTAAIKGKILSRCPGTQIIEITNQVPPFAIALAAFQLKNSFMHFPDGSVHIVAVNNTQRENISHVALKIKQHFFIGYNNGIFGLLTEDQPAEIVQLNAGYKGCFAELDVFADAASELVLNGELAKLGMPVSELNRQLPVLPAIDESVINGSIIYIDSYRNAFTNISVDVFERIGKGRSFEIFVQSNHNRISHLNTNYNESSPGELLAMFNSVGLLEIAINGGNAADLLNLGLNSSVRVKFRDAD